MTPLRRAPLGTERPGLPDAGGAMRDLTGLVPDIGGAGLADSRLAILQAIDPCILPVPPAPIGVMRAISALAGRPAR